MRFASSAAVLLLATTLLAGCLGEDDSLRLAFTVSDDKLATEQDPQHLAEWIQDHTGRDTRIHHAPNHNAVLQALRTGHADAAFVDGAIAWFAWQEFGVEVIAADVNADGRDHYVALAVVRADTPYQSMEDLRGHRSCHTGLLKSAGMFMPLGWMVRNGLVEVHGDADSVSAIVPTIEAFFSGGASIPDDGTPYSGYGGALRCLGGEPGGAPLGDVAFVKDTTVAEFCDPTHDMYRGQDNAWCLNPQDYRVLQEFGRVPSHPVIVPPALDAAKRADLQAALLALNDSPEGQEILRDVLHTHRIVATDAQSHLGDYSDNLRHVPGMGRHVEEDMLNP